MNLTDVLLALVKLACVIVAVVVVVKVLLVMAVFWLLGMVLFGGGATYCCYRCRR